MTLRDVVSKLVETVVSKNYLICREAEKNNFICRRAEKPYPPLDIKWSAPNDNTQCVWLLLFNNHVAILLHVIVFISSLGVCWQLGALHIKVLLPTRPNFGLGSHHHIGFLTQKYKLLQCGFQPRAICNKWHRPNRSHRFSRNETGISPAKLLSTVGSYCPVVSTIFTQILIISGPLSSTFARASIRIRQA